MTTKLTKAVRRESQELEREKGKLRPIVVTLYPSGIIGTRLLGLRQEETISLAAVHHLATKSRVLRERSEKAKAKKAKRFS